MKEFSAILRFIISIFLVGFCMGCTTSYRDREIYGADEFVIDSYKIREGKNAILEMQGKNITEFPHSYLEEYEDFIQEDDVLNIVIYHPKREDIVRAIKEINCSIGFKVVGGRVYLPDLFPIEVKGLTLQEAQEKIQKKYLEQIEDIAVFISYKDRMERKVGLAGLVQISSIPVDGKIRLFDVLSQAKVPPEANLFKSYLIRDDKILAVDFYKLLKEGDMTQNVVMRGGDKVYIAEPSAASLMVMGEVGVERVINLTSGKISLRAALAEARGIPYTGDRSYIQVIRGSILRPKIYLLSWEHVLHLPNDSLLLMPGDVVYVASKPITEWNRFISQLLPSFSCFDIAGKGMKNFGVCLP